MNYILVVGLYGYDTLKTSHPPSFFVDINTGVPYYELYTGISNPVSTE